MENFKYREFWIFCVVEAMEIVDKLEMESTRSKKALARSC